MRKRRLCIKCQKYVSIPGSYYCAECKAEAVRLEREKKRAYMKVYWATKKAAKEAAQAAAIAEAAKEAVASITPPQPGQWTTTSITTVTTNGDNPPTVHTETKTEPTGDTQMCTKCGKNPRLPRRTVCKECRSKYTAEWKKRNRAGVNRVGILCACCGKAPRWKTSSYCKECMREIDRESKQKRLMKERMEAAAGVRSGTFAKPCTKCGVGERLVGRSMCRSCYNEMMRIYNKRYTARRAAKKAQQTPIVVQQNNAQNNNVEKVVQPTLPDVQQAPIVVQQNNVQNNAPMHDLETVVPKEHTLNVNVTNPIKVDVQNPGEQKPSPWWVGYLVAAAIFLMWIGSMVKNWFK